MITARITCEAGHVQKVTFYGTFTRAYVESWCGLIDGTHPMFVHSQVGTYSPIGKCAWPVDGKPCGKQTKAAIVD